VLVRACVAWPSRDLFLDRRRVQHYTDTTAHGLGWQIASEAASDHSIATMLSGNLTPVDLEFTVVRFGNEGHLLANVESGVLLAIATLDLDERDIAVLRAKCSFVSQNGTVHVQAGGSFRCSCHDASVV